MAWSFRAIRDVRHGRPPGPVTNFPRQARPKETLQVEVQQLGRDKYRIECPTCGRRWTGRKFDAVHGWKQHVCPKGTDAA